MTVGYHPLPYTGAMIGPLLQGNGRHAKDSSIELVKFTILPMCLILRSSRMQFFTLNNHLRFLTKCKTKLPT